MSAWSGLKEKAGRTFQNVKSTTGEHFQTIGSAAERLDPTDTLRNAAGKVNQSAASTVSGGLSALDALATKSRDFKTTSAVVVGAAAAVAAIAAVKGFFGWRKKVNQRDEARAVEVDDLQARLTALKAARGETSAVAGSANDRATGGHVAATGRGQGMSQSA